MLHIFPNDTEIVEAVNEWLLNEVTAEAPPELAFKARIAANLLAALGREIEEGPELERQLIASLTALGAETEDDLARRIRSGTQGVDSALLATLRAITEARVRTWNPRHLTAVTDDDPRAVTG